MKTVTPSVMYCAGTPEDANITAITARAASCAMVAPQLDSPDGARRRPLIRSRRASSARPGSAPRAAAGAAAASPLRRLPVGKMAFLPSHAVREAPGQSLRPDDEQQDHRPELDDVGPAGQAPAHQHGLDEREQHGADDRAAHAAQAAHQGDDEALEY